MGKSSLDICQDPTLNQSTAFTEAEKEALGLVAWCPDVTESLELKLAVKRVLTHGCLYRKYLAAKEDCQSCPLRPRCIYAAGAKRKHLSVPVGISLSKQMVEKIETAQGRRIYPQRLAIAEPVFANIRINKRLDRFTLRSGVKVNIQWLLYCLIHNIEKSLNSGLAYA